MPAPRTPPRRGTTCRPGVGPPPEVGCDRTVAPGAGAASVTPVDPSAECEAPTTSVVVPEPGQGTTRNRGNGKRTSSAQAATVVGERAALASPSAASAVSARRPPVTAVRCAPRRDQVEVAGEETGRISDADWA